MTTLTPAAVVALQDGLLGLLGSQPEARPKLVTAMMYRDAREATSYWLQLTVSIGIATLGLVVGSTAVVIGAMLVAPLMGPIIGLAMGLATGSPFLVLRSAARVGSSVIVAVGGAAVITVLLPFHELNAEIAARTSPTVLDLLTAAFCALAGVYASLRPGSDTAATAAGTSIGISLVPPLCASGYGVGTGASSIAAGAGLLFLTNLVAIVVVGTISFVAAGFNRVGAAVIERDELSKTAGAPITAALARRLASAFESRLGPILRFLMPFALLGVVYFPLRKALDEVAWHTRARAVVQEAIAAERLRIVDTRVRVERHQVEVVLVILGDTRAAESARERLQPRIERGTGVAPRLEIYAVPDAAAFAGLESTLLKPTPAATTVQLATPSEELERTRQRIEREVRAVWPASTVGTPLAVDVGVFAGGPLRVRVVHIGSPLAPDAAEAVRRALGRPFDRETVLNDTAVAAGALAPGDDALRFLAAIVAGVQATRSIAGTSVCGTRPADDAQGSEAAKLASSLDAVLAAHPRSHVEPGKDWTLRFIEGECPKTEAAGTAEQPSPASSSVTP